MQVQIHRGADTIGGNCVAVASGSTRLLLDFGWPLGPPGDMDFQVQYRNKKTADLLNSGFLPKIQGLYPPSPPEFSAVLLTHYHPDHYGFLSHISPELPIYATRTTGRFIHAATIFGQAEPIKARIHSVTPYKSFTIGDFKITPYEADHSALGALAFLIQELPTGETLFYSGDIAGHVYNPQSFKRILSLNKKIDYLILEGTNISRGTPAYLSESDVCSALQAEFRRRAGLVVLACSSQNIPRLQTVYRAARSAGRYLVIDPYTAFILKMAESDPHNRLRYDSAGIKVLATKSSLTRIVEGHRGLYGRIMRNAVSKSEIMAAPEKYVIKDSWDARHKLIPRARKAGIPGVLIYSLWEGYLAREKAFWEENGVKIVRIHSSGHAYRGELSQIARSLNARHLIPIHTSDPAGFSDLLSR